MEFNLKQSGYFLILAALIIIIIGSLSTMLTYTFNKNTMATTNTFQTHQALYIANSGIEIAKRDLAIDTLKCGDITGHPKYTNAPLLNGRFTVIANYHAATSTLASNINISSTSVSLVNASSFASKGTIWVDKELIAYKNKSGNFLLNITRGETKTPITDHSSGDLVSQNQCILYSVGGIPTLTTSITGSKRTISQTLLGSVFSLGGYKPIIASVGPVTITGTSELINPTVTTSSKLFQGSTVVSAGTIELKGSGRTQVGTESGGLETSSDKDNTNADVIQNDPYLASGNLFEKYFGASEAVISAGADHSYDKNNIDGVTGKTIWVDSDLKFTGSGTITIGSPSDPVILIVDGDFEMVGSVNINFYGFLFVTGDIKLGGGGNFGGLGSIATTGSTHLAGNKIIIFDNSTLLRLAPLISTLSTHYNAHPISFTEIFS